MSSDIPLNRQCPTCNEKGVITLNNHHLICQNASCDFDITYCCPLCDSSLETAEFTQGEKDITFNCPSCKKEIGLKKIKHLLDNSLIIDKQSTCKICNGPTIHRPEANLGHRCFFFPSCSGQADLFGQAQHSLVFLDFETTGLNIGRDHIIEIGALKIDEEGLEHTYQSFIMPPVTIDPRITKITGITNEMVQGAPDIKTGIQELIDFIGDAKIIAHNAEFDVPWLITTTHQQNVAMKNNPVICTLKWAKKAKEARAGLGALTKKYNIGHQNAHRALADAAATKEIFLIFEEQYKMDQLEESIADYQKFCEKILGASH